jgi:hypothetical protein
VSTRKKYFFTTFWGRALNYIQDEKKLFGHFRIPTLKELKDLYIDEYHYHWFPPPRPQKYGNVKLTQRTWKKMANKWLEDMNHKGDVFVKKRQWHDGRFYYDRWAYPRLAEFIPIDYDDEEGSHQLIRECDWSASFYKCGKALFIQVEIDLSDLANEQVAKYQTNEHGEFGSDEGPAYSDCLEWDNGWDDPRGSGYEPGPVLDNFKKKFSNNAKLQDMLDGKFYFLRGNQLIDYLKS